MRYASLLLLIPVLSASILASDVVPVVSVYIDQAGSCSAWGLLVGGAVPVGFLAPEETAEMMRGGLEAKLYAPGGLMGTAVMDEPFPSELDPSVYELRLEVESGTTGHLVAVSGEGNFQPRPVSMQSTDQRVYDDAVQEVLEERGMSSSPRLTQNIRADLDGDGTEEVVLSANMPSSQGPGMTQPGPGDYSFVMIRQLVDGELRTTVLEGVFHTETTEMMMGANHSEVIGVLDLDGDGRMELVVSSEGWESRSLTVYAFDGEQWNPVLSEELGC